MKVFAPVAVLVLMAATFSQMHSVEAFTDFHAMNPNHVRTVLPDGRIHLAHDVHHVFEEHNSFFKAKYEAVHDAKWHFVELHHHEVDFLKHVDCGASDRELLISHPSESLKSALAKQDYSHTVLTAHHQFHCGEQAIFRVVVGATYHEESDVLQVHTVQVGYHDVFEYINYDQDTDHLEHYVSEAPDDTPEDEQMDYLLPSPQEDEQVAAYNQERESEEVMRRGFKRQGWFKKLWKKVKKAVKKVVKKVVKVVKKVVKTAVKIITAPIRIVKALITGTWKEDMHKKLAALKYNGAINKRFKKWAFTGDAKFACSADAAAGLRFRFLVKGYKLQLIEAYYYGSFKGGVRASFNAKVQYELERKKEVADIKIATITFAIGPVPVVIIITAPITVGFTLNIDGHITLNFLLYVEGSIKQGMRYTRAKGFETINEKKWKHQRDFSPRRFKYEIALVAWAQIMFRAQINFLGGAQAGLRVGGEVILKNSAKCMLLIQINLQPIILAGAQIDVRIGKFKIYQKFWGPKSLVSWKIPLLNFCIPHRKWSKWLNTNERQMQLEGTTSGSQAAENDGVGPSNPNEIANVPQQVLSYNESGLSWFGRAKCYREGLGQTSLHFSMQFFPTDNTTQLVLTSSQNITTDSSTTVDEDGISNYTYQMTNIQQTYECGQVLSNGSTVTMEHHVEEDPDEEYQANSTESVLGNISKTFNLSISSTDILDITVHSEEMFCGSVKLSTEVFNDDNSSFVIFASGESEIEPEGVLDKLKAYLIYVPILIAIIIAVIVGVVCIRRRNATAVHGANWAKVGGETEKEAIVNQNDHDEVYSQERQQEQPEGVRVSEL